MPARGEAAGVASCWARARRDCEVRWKRRSLGFPPSPGERLQTGSCGWFCLSCVWSDRSGSWVERECQVGPWSQVSVGAIGSVTVSLMASEGLGGPGDPLQTGLGRGETRNNTEFGLRSLAKAGL